MGKRLKDTKWKHDMYLESVISNHSQFEDAKADVLLLRAYK